MTPFEQGYAAFLAGVVLQKNPFSDECPYSAGRWVHGWMKARGDRK